MNRHHTFATLLIGALLFVTLQATAQKAMPPYHRFAVRWNTLGLLNLNGIGELEYSVSRMVGVYVGGGASSPVVSFDELGHKRLGGWGLVAGARFSIPIGNFQGLSLKSAVSYARIHGSDGSFTPCCSPTIYFSYIQNKIGGHVILAYAQKFAKRFFVEPTIGLGPTFGQLHVKGAAFEYMGLSVPVQLNLGVRF